jgi:hypothetical protein
MNSSDEKLSGRREDERLGGVLSIIKLVFAR